MFALLAASVAALFVVALAFAAFALLTRMRSDQDERRHARLVEGWEPVMLAVLEGAADDEVLHALVGLAETESFLAFLMDYARRLRGDERAVVRRLAAPYLPRLAATIGRGGEESRAVAIQRLAEMGMPEYADAVARGLDDRSPTVALIAARALFRPGNARLFPAVLAQLPRFTRATRSYLATVFAGGGSEGAPLLRDLLADAGRAPLVRAIAADALKLLNDLEAAPLAVAALTSDDRELVVASLRLIRQLGHREHVEAVRPLLRSTDPVVRAAAAGALGAVGGEADVPVLRKALDDSEYWVSLEAARGLMALGDVQTLRGVADSTGAWATLARQVLSE